MAAVSGGRPAAVVSNGSGLGLVGGGYGDPGWLIGLTPIWSAVLAALILRERFGAAKTIGLAVGFLGAALVVRGAAWKG